MLPKKMMSRTLLALLAVFQVQETLATFGVMRGYRRPPPPPPKKYKCVPRVEYVTMYETQIVKQPVYETIYKTRNIPTTVHETQYETVNQVVYSTIYIPQYVTSTELHSQVNLHTITSISYSTQLEPVYLTSTAFVPSFVTTTEISYEYRTTTQYRSLASTVTQTQFSTTTVHQTSYQTQFQTQFQTQYITVTSTQASYKTDCGGNDNGGSGQIYLAPQQNIGTPVIDPTAAYRAPAVAAPAPQQSYGTPQIQQQYETPQAPQAPQQSYAAPAPVQQSYGTPEIPQQSYVAPQSQQQFVDVPQVPQQSYDVPQIQQQSFGAPPTLQQSYELPQGQQQSYGVPQAPAPLYDDLQAPAFAPIYDDLQAPAPQQSYDVPIPQQQFFGESDAITAPQDSYNVPQNSFDSLQSFGNSAGDSLYQDYDVTFDNSDYDQIYGPPVSSQQSFGFSDIPTGSQQPYDNFVNRDSAVPEPFFDSQDFQQSFGGTQPDPSNQQGLAGPDDTFGTILEVDTPNSFAVHNFARQDINDDSSSYTNQRKREIKKDDDGAVITALSLSRSNPRKEQTKES